MCIKPISIQGKTNLEQAPLVLKTKLMQGLRVDTKGLYIQYYKTLSIVLQALCPPDLISWSHLSLPLYSNKGCDLGHTWIVVFPTFFNLRLNFVLRGSWSQPQSTPGIVFADYIEFLHFSCKVHINQISVLTIWWCPSAVQSSLVLLEEGVCSDQRVLLTKLC